MKATRLKRKKIKFLLLLNTFGLTAFAQAYYPLHPAIGDTLDRLEKLDYSLFPKIVNQGFQYGLITYENEAYVLNSYYHDSSKSIKNTLKQEEIVEAQQNIEKVNAYYLLKAKEDSSKANSSSLYPNKPTGKAPVLFSGPMSEQAKKEARMYQRIQADRQRQMDHQNGIRPNQLHIEFK